MRILVTVTTCSVVGVTVRILVTVTTCSVVVGYCENTGYSDNM